jgi:YidC/Oxa1 family membrane protein insertase
MASCQLGDPDYFPLALDLDDQRLAGDINRALFQVTEEPVYAEGDLAGGTRYRFTWSDGRGVEVAKSLTFREGDYLVGYKAEVIDRGRRVAVRSVWGPGFAAHNPGGGGGPSSYYNYNNKVLWNIQGQVTREKGNKIDDHTIAGKLTWAGMGDQYFTALQIPTTGQGSVRMWPQQIEACPVPGADEDEDDDPAMVPVVAVSVPETGSLLYIGPKKYSLQQEIGYELEKSIWFSSFSLLYPISKFLFLALLWIRDHTSPNYGLAIILATFCLRLVLFPLNQFSMVRMRKTQVDMARLQPKLKAIKNKYKKKKDAESRAKINQETMELYKKEGINPMGGMVGCLPMLIQFPILIGFYNMLTVAIELRGAPFFLWIQDLSLADPFWILPLLMGVTMFSQQKMSMGKTTDPQQKQQQKIMMFMPFFFTWICTSMPSGLVLYWFVNNLLGIGQQWLVNHKMNTAQPATAGKKG